MLEMSCRLLVACDDAPLVWQHIYLPVAHGYHGFDGYAHACLEHHPIATPSVIGYGWIFMHLAPDAMACEFTDNPVAERFAIVLYGGTDIAYMLARRGLLYTFIKAFLSDTKKLFDIFFHLAYTKGVATVTVVAVQKGPTINADDIALTENSVAAGYAMHNHTVDRCANRARERLSIWIGEILERGYSTMVANEFLGYCIQLESRYTGFDMSSQFSKRPTN